MYSLIINLEIRGSENVSDHTKWATYSIRARPIPSHGRNDKLNASSGFPRLIINFVFNLGIAPRSTETISCGTIPR